MIRWLWPHGDFMLGVVVRCWLSAAWTMVEGLRVGAHFLDGSGSTGAG